MAFQESNASGSYEARAEAIANDLADGITPEKVRQFREAMLALRQEPDVAGQIFQRVDKVYGRLLPGYGPNAKESPDAVYYIIGNDKQFRAMDADVQVREDEHVYKLYPRDYWLIPPSGGGNEPPLKLVAEPLQCCNSLILRHQPLWLTNCFLPSDQGDTIGYRTNPRVDESCRGGRRSSKSLFGIQTLLRSLPSRAEDYPVHFADQPGFGRFARRLRPDNPDCRRPRHANPCHCRASFLAREIDERGGVWRSETE